MLDLKFKRTIDKPIDEVWNFVIDGFTECHKWAYGTQKCRKGSEDEPFDRLCDTESGVLKDTITNIDHNNKLLEFSVEGLHFFVSSAKSSWKLNRVANNQTELIVNPRIEVIPVIGTLMQIPMRMILKKLYPKILNDMAIYVETGKPSPRKQKEIDGQV